MRKHLNIYRKYSKIRASLTVATTLLFALFAGGCTRNNGDIGVWFGMWRLVAIDVDGVPSQDYRIPMMWKFQSSIVNMVEVYEHDYPVTHFATWRELPDRRLEINFGHSDAETPPGTGEFAPPRVTHLPVGIAVLDIVRLTNRQMTLTYHAPNGTLYTYRLDR